MKTLSLRLKFSHFKNFSQERISQINKRNRRNNEWDLGEERERGKDEIKKVC